MSKKIPVGEIYTCLQGEGKYTGVPHVLIRTTGCPLRCQFSGGSFCDTPFASWRPEKGAFTYEDIEIFYDRNPQINYTMITGGEPTMHPEVLNNLVTIAHERGHLVTIETAGTDFVQTKAGFISLSPKLSNSTPIVGTEMPYTGKKVTKRNRSQHEKNRKNYEAMGKMIFNHYDYQFKPVISSEEDFDEMRELQQLLGIPNDKVYVMPEGLNRAQLEERRKWLTEICIKYGYNFSDRLQIITFGDRRGV